MSNLSHLFSPINIGSISAKNRIVFSAMHLGYATEDGFVTEQLKDFYEERARGGAGLLVLGMAFVDWVGTGGVGAGNVIGIDHDKFIPGLKELATVVHKYDVKFAAQLYHAGRYSLKSITGLQPVSASAIKSRLNPDPPRELSTAEVIELIEKYGQAARRAKEAGFDAVELTGTAGYIINQFLSPLTNQRTDRYGGSFNNRLRFIIEIIESIKEKTGKSFPLIYRTCGADFIEGGLIQSDYQQIVRETEKAGIDAVSVNSGWHEAAIPEITMQVPRGAFVFLAEGLKKVVKIPVIAANRINDPVLANNLIAQGRTDMVCMCRSLLADAELPNKAKNGQYNDIRFCIACNQGCLDNLMVKKPIECLVNARAGHEREYEIKPTAVKKRIAVIGGGPAGMEAARVARLRGHEVTLYEKTDRLGGLLNLASVPPGKGEIGSLVSYLSHQMHRLGVNLKLNTEATPGLLRDDKFDAFIIATGGEPLMPDIPGIKNISVVSAEDVLSGKTQATGKVIILGGGSVGCDVACFLADQRATRDDSAFFFIKWGAGSGVSYQDTLTWQHDAGSNITVLEMAPRIGKDIGLTTRWIILGELEKYGIKTITGAEVKEIADNNVIFEIKGEKNSLPADTVVLAAGYHATTTLVNTLKTCTGSKPCYVIGDCVEPRKAMDAIKEGFKTGNMV